MNIRAITPEEKESFDAVVRHPLQSYEWGEFREKTGVKVIRRGIFEPSRESEPDKLIGGFQVTIHSIPKTPFTIGYLPKGEYPTKELMAELKKIGKENNCIFIQLEPNETTLSSPLSVLGLKTAAHPLFTKFTFVLDLTPSEDELLKNMHQKARYNIKVAQKHEVVVQEDNSDEAFKEYLRLTDETTTRQKFYAHTQNYHTIQWQTLPHTIQKNALSSHLLTATYQGKVLTAWIVFVFKDTLYYPYGASSNLHREVMSSNLMMWEAIRFGKKLGLTKFDMWGALGTNPDKKDPWYGFHSFKERYAPKHIEFIGSFDFVIKPILYQGYKLADKLRWIFLKLKK